MFVATLFPIHRCVQCPHCGAMCRLHSLVLRLWHCPLSWLYSSTHCCLPNLNKATIFSYVIDYLFYLLHQKKRDFLIFIDSIVRLDFLDRYCLFKDCEFYLNICQMGKWNNIVVSTSERKIHFSVINTSYVQDWAGAEA